MEFREVLQKRRSIRAFRDQEVTDEQINEILEMANISPSAGNLQARSVVIVKDKETKEQLSDAALGQESVAEAAVIFVITANAAESVTKYGKRGQELYALQDATIFAAYLQLAVTELDLASVWVGAFDEHMVQDIIGLDKGLRPIALIPVGYGAEAPEDKDRKSLDELVLKKI